MSYPPSPRNSGPPNSFVRVNGKIRAREVRVIGMDGKQLGILPLGEAINLARQSGVDLVEIAPTANPPVCRIVDFGKYRYEIAKKEKESKKHQHANKVKEVQLSPHIDPHDFGVKMSHTIDFLCEDMKVKVTLRFRGREMAHQEFGFQAVNKLIREVEPWGHPDYTPKLVGKGITVMISPLPRNKRARHPKETDDSQDSQVAPTENGPDKVLQTNRIPTGERPNPQMVGNAAGNPGSGGDFSNNPFNRISLPS